MSKKEGVVRFSVSADKACLRLLDQFRKTLRFKSRSLVVAEMMRDRLTGFHL